MPIVHIPIGIIKVFYPFWKTKRVSEKHEFAFGSRTCHPAETGHRSKFFGGRKVTSSPVAHDVECCTSIYNHIHRLLPAERRCIIIGVFKDFTEKFPYLDTFRAVKGKFAGPEVIPFFCTE